MQMNIQQQTLFKTALVLGATGAIGQAFCNQLLEQGCKNLYRLARNTNNLPSKDTLIKTESVHIEDMSFDLTNEQSIKDVISALPHEIDLVVIATGWLHDIEEKPFASHSKKTTSFTPEKTFKSLHPEHLYKSMNINFLGPTLILKELLIHLPHRKHKTIFAVLSARVGSISDNKMGGWHSYRASKAALNMMIKNFAIELKRMRSKSLVVALQPGTTDSELSKPFQKFIKPEQLQTPAYTVEHLLKVLVSLNEELSGELIDFEGNVITP